MLNIVNKALNTALNQFAEHYGNTALTKFAEHYGNTALTQLAEHVGELKGIHGARLVLVELQKHLLHTQGQVRSGQGRLR